MTFDDELILIGESYTEDNIGNQIPEEQRTSVLCSVKSVSRSEFYTAASNGLKPSIVFVVHVYEYDGQQNVEFEGLRYKVIRTYAVNLEELELTVEKVIA